MDLISLIKENAKKNRQRIVLPEGEETRTLEAANILAKEGLADVILLGNPDIIATKASELNLEHLSKTSIVNPLDHPKKEAYAQLLYELRKNKGLTIEKATTLAEDPLYLATLMIKSGDADGEVAGAQNATGNVLRPAFQVVKTKKGINVVSGAFIMILKDENYGDKGIMVFADCAVTPEPNSEQLAEIAISSAETAKAIAGIDPKIAMLSFSTKGSAQHDDVSKVVKAFEIVKETRPDLDIDGELQADAAIVDAVGQAKAPGSNVAGHANVMVFPNLESGNIAYKLVQRLAGAEAIGPILQGMAAPINDLSRGCSVDDIVNLVAITANQSIALKNS
ncbi:phosphate acetyltransferase [Aureibacter tunicatorum]|uniref:Phosphate acetyltransferase n=1 Tax=Aureibacter tunicatorum TaxID=866807 RepID=A0AAE3XKB4_9BACT|nr:phosphate acetyltransferase [Aureibacter tunicatorum]MDR6239376.1 phosphate acetyltransferase [Aureibacter tunicatorum]BDD04701.1 phosphate acetyltransferase [Aureibacter tunicatorum]